MLRIIRILNILRSQRNHTRIVVGPVGENMVYKKSTFEKIQILHVHIYIYKVAKKFYIFVNFFTALCITMTSVVIRRVTSYGLKKHFSKPYSDYMLKFLDKHGDRMRYFEMKNQLLSAESSKNHLWF